MRERLVVDSLMTADGEVVQLPTLGPLGPVDAEGGRIPLDIVIKSCMADFKSGHGLTFRGDDNWLVCPRDLADELHDKMLLPLGVQVYCPDNGGSLRLRYDLGMRGAGSLREDSTLCLLWAMLMDSYSRWRTTGGVFIEAGD